MDTPVTATTGGPIATKTVSAMVAIYRYFLADMTAPAALKEVKRLSPEDKAELAAGAAIELGVTLV